MKTALVLSAGGMFGAYQAGAWSVLSDWFEPDLIVGASAGAINGWAIAGGCPPAQLIDYWLSLDAAASYRWQRPRALHGGILDTKPLMARVEDIYAASRPKIDLAVVVTELARLRPRIVRGSEITLDVLKASTAIFGLFEQVTIDGKVYTDGGTLAALPVWAAAELGAECIVAVNALPVLPGLIPRLFVKIVKTLSSFRPAVPDGLEVIRISPARPLGSGIEAIRWTKKNAQRWIEQGRSDAKAATAQLTAPGVDLRFERK